MVAALRAAAARLETDADLARAIAAQDATASLPIVRRALYGV